MLSLSKKPSSPILQLRHCLSRSHSFVDCVRPSPSLRTTSDPVSSRSAGVKSVKASTKWKDESDLKLLFEEPPKNSDGKHDLKLNQDRRELYSSDYKKRSVHAQEAPTNDSNSSLATNRFSCARKSDNSAAPINISKQLMNMRRAPDASVAKQGFMKIKSLQKKGDVKSKTFQSKQDMRNNQSSPLAPRPSACRDVVAPFNLIRQRNKELNAKVGPPKLEIRHIEVPVGRESPRLTNREEFSSVLPYVNIFLRLTIID